MLSRCKSPIVTPSLNGSWTLWARHITSGGSKRGGGVKGFNTPLEVFFACQNLKIPADLDPNFPPPLEEFRPRPPPLEEFVGPPLITVCVSNIIDPHLEVTVRVCVSYCSFQSAVFS